MSLHEMLRNVNYFHLRKANFVVQKGIGLVTDSATNLHEATIGKVSSLQNVEVNVRVDKKSLCT